MMEVADVKRLLNQDRSGSSRTRDRGGDDTGLQVRPGLARVVAIVRIQRLENAVPAQAVQDPVGATGTAVLITLLADSVRVVRCMCGTRHAGNAEATRSCWTRSHEESTGLTRSCHPSVPDT